jgi:hypothetical protein
MHSLLQMVNKFTDDFYEPKSFITVLKIAIALYPEPF